MKFLLTVLLSVLLTNTAKAEDSLKKFFESENANIFCRSNLIPNNNFKINILQKYFAPYLIRAQTAAGESEITLINLSNNNNKTFFYLKATVYDVVVDKRKLLILTPLGLYVGNLDSKTLVLKKTSTHSYSEKEDFPRQMILRGQYIYVAHGKLGLSVLGRRVIGPLFTNSYNKVLGTGKRRSSITGIAFKNNSIYLAVASTKGRDQKDKTLDGLLKLNSKLRIIKVLEQPKTFEQLSSPRLMNTTGSLVMQSLKKLLIFKSKDLKKDKANPSKVVSTFKQGQLFGKPVIRNNKVYGCFIKRLRKKYLLTSGVGNF